MNYFNAGKQRIRMHEKMVQRGKKGGAAGG